MKTDKSKKSNKWDGLSLFAYKEIYFKPCTDISINSNEVEPLWIETHLK